MKKLLDVPMQTQPFFSIECGAACAKMILDYDHKSISYDAVNDDLPVRKGFGLYIYEIGSYFLKQGYQAEIVGFNTHFLQTQHLGKSTDVIKKQALSVQKWRKKDLRWKHILPGIDTLLDFIDNGGTFKAKYVETSDITSEIQRDRPVLAALTTNFMYPEVAAGHSEHFNVMTGFDHQNFYLNDPGAQMQGIKRKKPKKDIIFAIHSNTGRSVEGGTILKVCPRA